MLDAAIRFGRTPGKRSDGGITSSSLECQADRDEVAHAVCAGILTGFWMVVELCPSGSCVRFWEGDWGLLAAAVITLMEVLSRALVWPKQVGAASYASTFPIEPVGSQRIGDAV